ncbi:hypothetical protein NKJ46_31585 [Mesorhizobium sp. M0166]|uniref:sigma factor-like helix-turn-helix DNA-binding protein n=1 Tax=Mesorhizobium sp. M0166 TaxID=2956902 RepID=UPI003337C006
MADGVIRDTLERSIDELPDELRRVLVACVVDGMTPEQFAELFALTSETVEARLHNARSCWLKCLCASSVPPSVASIRLTIAVPSALRMRSWTGFSRADEAPKHEKRLSRRVDSVVNHSEDSWLGEGTVQAARISNLSASYGTGVKVYLACPLPIMGFISCHGRGQDPDRSVSV